MSEREVLVHVDCRDIDDRANAFVRVCRINGRLALVVSVESDGDVEVLIDQASAQAIANALKEANGAL